MVKKALFGISEEQKKALLAAMNRTAAPRRQRLESPGVQEKFLRFEELPEYKQLKVQQSVAAQVGIEPPFYICHDSMAKATTHIGGRELLNFSTYDYLDLNGHPVIAEAVTEALARYGSSASASRLTAGDRPPHRELELALAGLYGVEDAIAFVSGHATNVSTLGQIFGAQDVIFYDSLSHNSLIQGALASGAARLVFPNNDMEALERLLRERRHEFQRAVIVTEGLFSMDGCICNLPRLVELKKKYQTFLMVDEAHSLGVLGGTGRGVHEFYGIPSGDVDIWMGTLSKSFCGCGGFIAGSAVLVEYLKYTAPGFVYSVGMSPVLAAASLAAVRQMLAEPWRVTKLHENSAFFLEYARDRGLDTGRAEGFAVVPVMVGSSLTAALLSQELKDHGVLALPIIYPGVEEGRARLRFFISASHNRDQLRRAVDAAVDALPVARERVALCVR